jgi:MOSC domain-containing protein YiiM
MESKGMKLQAVNVGDIKELIFNGQSVKSGIDKKPVDGKIQLLKTGLIGDKQADPSVHGGLDKAIYAYTSEHYSYWENRLKINKLPYGHFGENFTVESMDDKAVLIGDIYEIGGALLQVTQPRVPCFKLGIRMNDPMFPAKFLKSGCYGFYLRVVEEGFVEAGDTIKLIEKGRSTLSVWEIMQVMHAGLNANCKEIMKALSIQSLSADWRSEFEKKLSSLA